MPASNGSKLPKTTKERAPRRTTLQLENKLQSCKPGATRDKLFSMMWMRWLFPLVFLVGCQKRVEKIEPQIHAVVQEGYLRQLPSPFAPLTEAEMSAAWGKEYQIALGFAHELDLYQAMTGFKRAFFLAPADAVERRLELQYNILLSYYLGKRYADVVYTYEKSELRSLGASFPAAEDLLVMLYESYLQAGEGAKAAQMLEHLKTHFPKTQEKLVLSTALKQADFATLERSSDPAVQDLLTQYDGEKKSVKQAQTLNALLPGAGYAYLGQKQSAVTAFFLNGLFIAAAYHFFHKGHLAAGIVTSGFEMGWYIGGVNGAKEAATLYNERIWERQATPLMNRQGLFPVFLLHYGF